MPITEDISSPGAGEYTTGAAQVPGTPTHVGSATNQISIAFSTGTNGSEVTYLIYVDIDGGSSTGYVQSDDGAVEAGESWATAATWGSIINVTGLTGVHGYKFKVAARNEALLPAIPVYSAFSTTMVPLLDLAYSSLSNTLSLEVTTGNVKISGLTVTAVGAASPGVYTIGYTLTRIHNPTTKANVKIAYSLTGGVGTYIDLTDGSISGSITTLTASASGTSNSNTWASCVTCGNSYANTIYIRVTPYDSATAGDAGDAAVTTVAVDNRPLTVTIAEFSGLSWDKDVTPEIIFDMASVVCGSYIYHIVHVYDSTGTEIQTNSSAEITDGFYYEADHAGSPGSAVRYDETGWQTGWTANTWTGIAATLAPPTVSGNRVRYIFQTAITAGTTVSIRVQQAEIRAENI